MATGWYKAMSGQFIPAMKDDGLFIYNKWGEQKFWATDGMHRCTEMVCYF
jgi:hypothetical protein